MPIKRFPLLLTFCLQFSLASAQVRHPEKVNTTAAEAYFTIASALAKNGDINTAPWPRLFQTAPYQMMIAGNAVDTVALKVAMQRIFSSVPTESATPLSAQESYHQAHKERQTQLQAYIRALHENHVADSVKALLYPFLPQRLQGEALFPTLFYLPYGSAEATGFGGVVLNDLLHAYTIDTYKFGLLAAHEAFHSIVSSAFGQKLKPTSDYSATDFNLLYFLQNVSEEGIADLIDKPLLLQKDSPLYSELLQLTADEEAISISLIKKLDDVLTRASRSEEVLLSYNGFAALANAFGKNGGHIPGRIMGRVIQQAGLLPRHIDAVENPVSFVVTYNAAAQKIGQPYPIFSKESVEFLQRIKSKYWQV